MTTAEDPRDDPRWDLVRAAAKRPVPTPYGLVARVLKSVHGVRGRLLSEPLELPLEGDRLRISERVLVLLARRLGADLASAIGGLHVSAVALEHNVLEVLTTIHYGVAADEVAERLRAQLREALSTHLGGPAPAVNVHVVDVHHS